VQVCSYSLYVPLSISGTKFQRFVCFTIIASGQSVQP